MILAAGIGSRLRPLTDRMPKALVPVNDVPLVMRQIHKLSSSGFRDITVNVHHFADMLCDYLDANAPTDVKIRISSEREKLLNTGGALRKAADQLLVDGYEGNVLIHNVDILSNADLSGLFAHSSGHDATLLVSERNASRRLLFDADSLRLVGWKNFTTGEVRTPYPNLDENRCLNYAFSGIHVVSPALLRKMQSWLDAFSVIDFYLQECLTSDIRAYFSPTLKLLDVGKIDTLADASAFAAELQ